MVRRVFVTVAAVALVLGIGMVTAASTAEASVPTITANGSATCTNLGGVIHFTPPLSAAGTSNTESVSFSVNLNSLSSGCSTTATNLPAGGILYGKATATLTTTTTDNSANSCASLGTSGPLSMTIAWHYKNSSAMILAKLPSTTVSFSGLDSPTNSASEPGYVFPEAGGTSPSSGSFAGALSEVNVFGARTTSFIATKCGRSTGLTSLKLDGAGTTADPSLALIGAQSHLAELASSIDGTGGLDLSATNLDSNAAGAPGTETLQTVLGIDSLNVPTMLVSGTFTITTNVGTLTGTAEGEFDVGIFSEHPPQVAGIDGGLILTVTSGTGQFTGTTGTLFVSFQYPTFGSDFFNGSISTTAP